MVQNLTAKTVILSDLRAEIAPRKVLDLERVNRRDSIDRSRDLKQAFRMKQLRLIKHSVIKTKAVTPPPETVKVVEKTTEKIIERDKFDEERLRDLIKNTVSDELNKDRGSESKENNVGDTVRQAVSDLQNSIRDQLNNLRLAPGEQQNADEVNIDPEKLADLQQRSVERVSGEIETGGKAKVRKIKITNSNVRNLADEL